MKGEKPKRFDRYNRSKTLEIIRALLSRELAPIQCCDTTLTSIITIII